MHPDQMNMKHFDTLDGEWNEGEWVDYTKYMLGDWHEDSVKDYDDRFPYAGYVPEGSIHAESNYVPMRRYSQTDMDVITEKTWAEVGFVWDYDAMYDWYAFKYYVGGELVDVSYYTVLSNIYSASDIYPNRILFGA